VIGAEAVRSPATGDRDSGSAYCRLCASGRVESRLVAANRMPVLGRGLAWRAAGALFCVSPETVESDHPDRGHGAHTSGVRWRLSAVPRPFGFSSYGVTQMANACRFPAPTDPKATMFAHTPNEHRR